MRIVTYSAGDHLVQWPQHLAAGKRESMQRARFWGSFWVALVIWLGAAASLQAMLTRYPKARRFGEVEAFLRSILAGETKAANGRPLVPPCVDPR